MTRQEKRDIFRFVKENCLNVVCVLKDGTADALLELAPISQDTCTGQTKENLDLI